MKTQQKYAWLKGAASLLLLFGYFLNVVSFQSFHYAVHHHHHAELHTEEAETDACHRAVYHGETSHECEHKSHLSETHDHCELCKVTVSRFHFSPKITQAAAQPFEYKTHLLTSIDLTGFGYAQAFSPRGPPTFS